MLADFKLPRSRAWLFFPAVPQIARRPLLLMWLILKKRACSWH